MAPTDRGSSSGMGDFGSVSIAVVTAVAAAGETDPTALPPLYETIDPDVLDALAACETVGVTFEYAGYEIHVGGREAIALESPSG